MAGLVELPEELQVSSADVAAELGRPRAPVFRPELIDELVAAAGPGTDVFGPDGLLRSLTKAVLERALAAELTAHLGYEKGDSAGNGSGNSRNGTSPKQLHTDVGTVGLQVPRDRAGTFTPQVVRKSQTRLEGFNERIISLYASGMTVRDIRAHLAELYDVEVSPDLISRVTDAVHTEVKDWQSRPLDRVYPVIWLDALVCKVRDEGVVRNKAAHLALGVTAEGRKEVLGLWVEANEGAKFWLRVMNELRARGVGDVLVLVCDGLNGLPEAVEAVWPAAWVQTSSVQVGVGGTVPLVTGSGGRGPMQTCAFEALMQTLSLPPVAGFAAASGSCAASTEMRFRRSRHARVAEPGKAGRRWRSRRNCSRAWTGMGTRTRCA